MLFLTKLPKANTKGVNEIKCFVRFTGPKGQNLQYQLETVNDDSNSLWMKTLGWLGQAQWELVSLQHGALSSGNQVSLDNGIAYFKRQSTSDRPVNEPNFLEYKNKIEK
jgi:hypothetical protein